MTAAEPVTVLPSAQRRVLDLAEQRLLVVVWLAEVPGLGARPWYALTGGVLPTTLHALWLAGLVRLDRGASVVALESRARLRVGRARLTPEGRRRLDADREAA